jgi:hypothetical protein
MKPPTVLFKEQCAADERRRLLKLVKTAEDLVKAIRHPDEHPHYARGGCTFHRVCEALTNFETLMRGETEGRSE